MIRWDCDGVISSEDEGKFFSCKLICSRNYLVSSATGEISYRIRSKLSTTPGPLLADELSSFAPIGDTSSVNALELYLEDMFDWFEFLFEEKFWEDLALFELFLLFYC